MDEQALTSSLLAVRAAGRRAAALPAAVRTRALQRFAALIDARRAQLLAANRRDLDEQRGVLDAAMFQRLQLDDGKLDALVQGVTDLAAMEDPVDRPQQRTELDAGLVLERVAVPIGVIGVIFEARPDVIPQILSLVLRSGNVAILKGGREALHSNRAFLALVAALNAEVPELPDRWATLLESREQVRAILDYPQYVDLVIPRGSNELVRDIQARTRIPVLGHAEGVCHVFVHRSADVGRAVDVAIDAKAQYPSACNALETLLVDAEVAPAFLAAFGPAAVEHDVALRGCPRTRALLPACAPATDEDWRAEYGDLTLAVRVVDDLDAAIEHIDAFGSGHTECIVAADEAAIEAFLQRVDAASVFANASTRFADGFRYGLGAEVGISTNKTHARGPVGVEGLMIYKYRLRGAGQLVRDYTGRGARRFTHRRLDG